MTKDGDAVARLKRELGLTQAKSAAQRAQVRAQQRRIELLKATMEQAILDIEDGEPDRAVERLDGLLGNWRDHAPRTPEGAIKGAWRVDRKKLRSSLELSDHEDEPEGTGPFGF